MKKKIIAVLVMLLVAGCSAFAFTFTEDNGEKVVWVEPGECVEVGGLFISNETDMEVMFPYERQYHCFLVIIPGTNEWAVYSNVKKVGYTTYLLGVNKSRYRGEMVYEETGNLLTWDMLCGDYGLFPAYVWLGDCCEFENDRYIIRSLNDYHYQIFDKGVEERE